jgi:hypothetical protein
MSLKLENHAQIHLFHFLMRLPQRRKNYPRKGFHFFNELEIRKPCSKTSISFFNEVASETQKLSSKTSVSFFNEVAVETPKLSSETFVSFFNEVVAETQKLSSELSS